MNDAMPADDDLEAAPRVTAYRRQPPPQPFNRGWTELKAHARRVVFAGLGSEALPSFLRTRLMRFLGFDVAASACIWSQVTLRSRDVSIGENVFINIGFFHDGADRLVVGPNVRMGPFVRILTATHEIGPSAQRCAIEALTAPVVIEAGAWIGAGVTILPGVTIRRGCVIGANSLVTSSTEPDGVYAGHPARRVRDLPP